MIVVLGDKDDDDVVGDVGAGVSVDVCSVGDGGAPDGLRLFRYHYRGGVAIIISAVVVAAAASLSLLWSLSFSLLLHDRCHLVA